MIITKETVIAEIQNLDEMMLSRVWTFIKSSDFTAHNIDWTEDYKRNVLGQWKGNFIPPVSLPVEERIEW